MSKPMGTPKVVEDPEREALGHAGAEAARVEDVDDLGLVVVVEQAVNLGDHDRINLAQLSRPSQAARAQRDSLRTTTLPFLTTSAGSS